MEKVTGFVKREKFMCIIVSLAAVLVLATGSISEAVAYTDIKVIAIMWAFMIEIGGLNAMGLFDRAGLELSKKKNIEKVSLILVAVSWVAAFIVTDYAVVLVMYAITFSMFKDMDAPNTESLMPKVLALETVAAMAGGMLTPMGNLVNISLYEITGIDTGEFIRTMLPYAVTGLAIVFLATVPLLFKKADKAGETGGKKAVSQGFFSLTLTELFAKSSTKYHSILIMYLMLSVVTVLTTLGHLPYGIMIFIVAILILLSDRKGFTRADYPLLVSVAGMYIIAGCLGKLADAYNGVLIYEEQYKLMMVILSQVLGNAPTGFTMAGRISDISGIIAASNVAGFGLISASITGMASYRTVCGKAPKIMRPFLKYYILINVVILAILMVVCFVS